MLRISVILLFLAFVSGRADARARPDESPASANADAVSSGTQPMPAEPRSASPWSPLNSHLRTGGSALVTLLDLYTRHLVRNQPEIYRIAPEDQRPQQHGSSADKIKLVPITEDLSPSGAQYSPRLPPGHPGNGEEAEGEIDFTEDERLKSRLPVHPSVPGVPGRQSKISNGSLLNVTALQTPHQDQTSRNCFQSGPSSYCEDVEDYPAETIRQLLANEVSGITKFFSPLELKAPAPKPFANRPANSPASMAMAHEGAVIHTRVKPVASAPTSADVSFNAEEDYSLCGALRTDTFPKAAKSLDGDWLTIVNQDNIRQAISVEKCNAVEKPCKFARNFPAGFKAVCKQKYMRHRLTVFKNNEIKQDTFLFPSCCVCEVRPIGALEGERVFFTNDDLTQPGDTSE